MWTLQRKVSLGSREAYLRSSAVSGGQYRYIVKILITIHQRTLKTMPLILCGDILKKKKKYLEYHLLRHEATVAMPNIHNLADESIPEIIALIYCSSRISRMKNPHEK